MKNFALVTNTTKDPDGVKTQTAKKIIEGHGGICSVCLSRGETAKGVYEPVLPSMVPAGTELIISLGGDGSFLHTAKDLIDLNLPVMGVNLGTLGYLTEMDLSGFAEEFRHIMAGEYQIEERMLLKGTILRKGTAILEDIAINDIVLNRTGNMSIIRFDILVNERFLNSYSADGYIICSPTGSTGYNLSAGGPVAHPESEIIIATPICEHSLNSRSVVFSADTRIDVIPKPGQDDFRQTRAVSFDGSNEFTLLDGDIVQVCKSEKKLRNLRLDKLSFVEHLGRKMR